MEQNNNIPKHVVLFPDGNRRWAKEKGLSILEGHLRGKENFDRFLSWCKKRGVKIVTVFGFSTENWNRPEEEVAYLMELLAHGLSDKEAIRRFQEEGVKVKVIGQKEKLPDALQRAISHVEEVTKDNDIFQLNLAVSYGGRWDIVQATQHIIKDKIPAEKVTEELVSQYLSTAGLPDPDLIIRAGGEKRLSNFVLWQVAYAELYFSSKYWPDFTEQDLGDVFAEYARRQRRFGH